MMITQERLVAQEIKRLTPVLGRENATRLSKAYLLADEEMKQRIFELLDTIKAAVMADSQLRNSVLREPPTREESDGDVEIGNVLYGRKRLYPYSIPRQALLMHMGIFGSSGYGKTNLAYNMVEKVSNQEIPVIIFDFSKRNYRDLLATPLKNRIDIYTIGRDASPFRFNPIKPPPGIQLSQWIKEFSSIFDHAYWLLGGGRHVIMKSLDNVYMENKSPTLQDLKTWINDYGDSSLPARERNWVATAERPLESLCFKEIGEIFEVKEGFIPSDFFKPGRITILELDALDVNDKSFFIEIILQWIRDWLLVHGKKEQLAGVVFMEEAHHVLNREKSRKLGTETVMELVFREVRELGLGIIYIDQHPSLVSYPALGNTSTHIYMNLGLDTKQSSDIQDASNMLGLDEDETPYLRQLPVGHGFILSRQKLHPPFLIEFPKFPMEKGNVTDSEIRKHMQDRLGIEEGLDNGPPEVNEQGMKIIKAIGSGGGSFASQIYTKAKMSGKTFEKNVKKLVDSGLVGMKKAKIGKNVLHFYFLLSEGEMVFSENFKAAVPREKDMTHIISMLEDSGWRLESNKKRMVFDDGGKRMTLIIETGFDRGQMQSDLRETPYFICASDAVRNHLLQEAARLSYQDKSLTIFIANPDKFTKKKGFEKVAFS